MPQWHCHLAVGSSIFNAGIISHDIIDFISNKQNEAFEKSKKNKVVLQINFGSAKIMKLDIIRLYKAPFDNVWGGNCMSDQSNHLYLYTVRL